MSSDALKFAANRGGRTLIAGLFLVVAYISFAMEPIFRAWVSGVERFDPVLALDFDKFHCDGLDLIAEGWMFKNQVTIDGRKEWADIKQLLTYRSGPGRRFVDWDPVNSDETELINRTPGWQIIVLRLKGNCGFSFDLNTEHTHPQDPSIILRQGWGPFGENEDAPYPRRLY